MYATTGRNAPSKTTAAINASNASIEMTIPEGGTRRQWYRRLPSTNNRGYVLGDDEEDEMMPR